ncbi:hypothetical protein AB0H00_12075 [Nocardia sp. NPDC023852]|uniref:hypothetical protein n=1 Tax=unclassified Nocardia TaxID=2637762 RepID=UPI0033DCC929|nr:hypothetical protein OH799_04520 [Nocardia sp. NBC_00881]
MRAAHAIAACLVTTAAVVGCGDEAKKAVNRGGDTKCSEFVAQDADKQRITVTKFLEQERSGNAPPSEDRTIDAAVAAIELMCSAQANPDTPIRKADLSGVLVPK